MEMLREDVVEATEDRKRITSGDFDSRPDSGFASRAETPAVGSEAGSKAGSPHMEEEIEKRNAPMTPAVGTAPMTPAVGTTPMTPAVGTAPMTPAVGTASMTPTVGTGPMTPAVGAAPMTYLSRTTPTETKMNKSCCFVVQYNTKALVLVLQY